jgi:acyl carrier protein
MDIRKGIRQFLREYFILDEDLGDDASFLESGVVDSTGVLELVLFAEETFGIQVDDHDVVPENFDSVNQLAAYIARQQRETSPESIGNVET